MTKNTITPLPSAILSHPTIPVSLQSVMDLLQTWRQGKTKRNEKIPDNIWDMIFTLLETMNTTRVLAALGLTQGQLRNRRLELQGSEINRNVPGEVAQAQTQSVEFCKVKSTFPLEHKPAKAFSTTTSVVELYRPDGMLMKIHICTDSFEDLLRAFFKG